MLKLYDCSTAPSPRRARMFLAEKGLEWETVEVDLRSGEQMGEAFRKVNPSATVPVLVTEDGERITENIGIAAYLEARHPEPPLMGTTPIEKAQVLGTNYTIEMGGLVAIAEALRNASPAMKGRALPGPVNIAQIPALAERGVKRLGHFFDAMERRMEGRDFAATDRYTLADITLTVTYDFSKWVKAQPGADTHPALARYMERMRERASYSL